VQTLKNKILLEKDEMQIQVNNRASVAAVVVGYLDLHLSSGLILEFSSVYFVPSICRNIISVSRMDMDDFYLFYQRSIFFFF
jgi:hypothetical protein